MLATPYGEPTAKFGEAVDQILADSLPARQRLSDLVEGLNAAAKSGSSPESLAEASASMDSVLKNRSAMLTRAEQLTGPADSQQVRALLVQSFSLSYQQDEIFSACLEQAVGADLRGWTSCTAPAADIKVHEAKTAFLNAYVTWAARHDRAVTAEDF